MSTIRYGRPIQVQICDGTQGCGNIIPDPWPTRVRCDWQRHGKWGPPKYAGHHNEWVSNYRPVKGDAGGNAPIMRKAIVAEVQVLARKKRTPSPFRKARSR